MDETRPQDTEFQGSRLDTLLSFSKLDNICPELDDNEITRIGQNAVKFATSDDESRHDWVKKSKEGMKLAMQVVEHKTFPWPDASNIKYPGITNAALQFHARAYPAMVPGNRVVKTHVTGKDPEGKKAEQSKRIAEHMNWQLLEENEEWESDLDRLLLALAIEGTEFKKSYFSSALGYNVSEWIRPQDLIVHDKTKSFKNCPRITHVVRFYPHEIDDKMRSGVWNEEPLGITEDERDEEVLQEFYEQHTFLDLDKDGYKEPYIVTVHKESEKVVRIVAGYFFEDIEIILAGKRSSVANFSTAAAINGMPTGPAGAAFKEAVVAAVPRFHMFTKFSMVPSPDGSFYDIGFGQLIGPLSDSIDTILNELVDAGSLSNLQAGFIKKGVNVDGRRGDLKWERGVFKEIQVPTGSTMSESIYQIKFPEPSTVLYSLLGLLIQATKDVTSVQDIMSGSAPEGSRESATTSAIRIEQGMKVFSSIYKRIYRSLKQEFKKLYKLNGKFLEPEQYFRVLDTQEEGVVSLSDYKNDGTDVQPVADPQASSQTVTMAKNQAILQVMSHPLVNDEEALMRFFRGLDIPAPEALIIPQEARQSGPTPEQLLEAKVEASKHAQRVADIALKHASAVEKIASAEDKEAGRQIELYTIELKRLQEMLTNGTGTPGQMEARPGNGRGQGMAPQGAAPIQPGGAGGIGLPESVQDSDAVGVPEGAI